MNYYVALCLPGGCPVVALWCIGHHGQALGALRLVKRLCSVACWSASVAWLTAYDLLHTLLILPIT